MAHCIWIIRTKWCYFVNYPNCLRNVTYSTLFPIYFNKLINKICNYYRFPSFTLEFLKLYQIFQILALIYYYTIKAFHFIWRITGIQIRIVIYDMIINKNYNYNILNLTNKKAQYGYIQQYLIDQILPVTPIIVTNRSMSLLSLLLQLYWFFFVVILF